MGNRRRDLPAGDAGSPAVSTAGDAFEIDQTDRDHSRVWCLPSARADGHKLDSNRNSVDRSPPLRRRQGAGRRSIKTRSETWFAVCKGRRVDGFKNQRSPHCCFLISIAECFVGRVAQPGEQAQYSRGRGRITNIARSLRFWGGFAVFEPSRLCVKSLPHHILTQRRKDRAQTKTQPSPRQGRRFVVRFGYAKIFAPEPLTNAQRRANCQGRICRS
jgi:hypothetical protein